MKKLILIGSSTGGPGRINQILSSLSPDFSASIIIAQHMVDLFIPSFVKQLDAICPLPVVLVNDGLVVQASTVYICSNETKLFEKHGNIYFGHSNMHKNDFSPDINILFSSASLLKYPILAIVLTGIGEDGALGLKKIFDNGGQCMFESEESAVVYGMPKKAKEEVPQGKEGNINTIVSAIKQFGQ